MPFWSRDLSSKGRAAFTGKQKDSMEMVPNTVARPPWAPHVPLNPETKQGVILLPGVRKSMVERSRATRVSLSTVMACG